MIESASGQSFLGCDTAALGYQLSRVIVIPAPFDASTSYQQGTQQGPAAILKASAQVETYDIELNKDFHTVGIHTTPSLDFKHKSAEKACSRAHSVASASLRALGWILSRGK